MKNPTDEINAAAKWLSEQPSVERLFQAVAIGALHGSGGELDNDTMEALCREMSDAHKTLALMACVARGYIAVSLRDGEVYYAANESARAVHTESTR